MSLGIDRAGTGGYQSSAEEANVTKGIRERRGQEADKRRGDLLDGLRE